MDSLTSLDPLGDAERGSVPTWKRRMSRGFPAFFRQFWLHLRKNLRKNLGWDKINSGCTSKSRGSQRPPPRPREHSRAGCPHCLGVPSWRWHHQCHITHHSARCPLHHPTCDTHLWVHRPTPGDMDPHLGTQPQAGGHSPMPGNMPDVSPGPPHPRMCLGGVSLHTRGCTPGPPPPALLGTEVTLAVPSQGTPLSAWALCVATHRNMGTLTPRTHGSHVFAEHRARLLRCASSLCHAMSPHQVPKLCQVTPPRQGTVPPAATAHARSPCCARSACHTRALRHTWSLCHARPPCPSVPPPSSGLARGGPCPGPLTSVPGSVLPARAPHGAGASIALCHPALSQCATLPYPSHCATRSHPSVSPYRIPV